MSCSLVVEDQIQWCDVKIVPFHIFQLKIQWNHQIRKYYWNIRSNPQLPPLVEAKQYIYFLQHSINEWFSDSTIVCASWLLTTIYIVCLVSKAWSMWRSCAEVCTVFAVISGEDSGLRIFEAGKTRRSIDLFH